jgi:hypothetical protein
MGSMRPKLDHSKLFAPKRAERTDASEATRQGSRGDPEHTLHAQSGINRIAATSFEAAASPSRPLRELDAFLGARLLRLEITATTYEDAALLAEARLVRAGLLQAAAFAPPLPTDTRTFRAALGDTLRGLYAWVFGGLDAVFLGEPLRPVPRRLTRELQGHATVALLRSKLDPVLEPLNDVLVELARSCTRLSRAW